MITIKRLFVILILWMPFLSEGQSIKGTYIGISSFQKGFTGENLFVGLGYEQNVGTKISVSLDYNISYSLSGADEDYVNDEFSVSTGSDVFSYDYYSRVPWSEFAYTSKYFFRENKEHSCYVSAGIALRSVNYEVNIFNVYNQNYGIGNPVSPIGEGIHSKKTTLTPISFRFGFRNAIDGWGGDYYFGLNFIPGTGSIGTGNTLIDNAIDSQVNSFYYCFGCSFHFGWAD